MELYAISSVNPAEGIAVDFGLTTDLPVVGDVDGDGKADFGVYGYYPGVGYRYDFLLSSRTSTASPFGFDPNQRFIFDNYGHGAVYGSPTATPVVADFDGSGHAGLAPVQPVEGGNGAGPGRRQPGHADLPDRGQPHVRILGLDSAEDIGQVTPIQAGHDYE